MDDERNALITSFALTSSACWHLLHISMVLPKQIVMFFVADMLPKRSSYNGKQICILLFGPIALGKRVKKSIAQIQR